MTNKSYRCVISADYLHRQQNRLPCSSYNSTETVALSVELANFQTACLESHTFDDCDAMYYDVIKLICNNDLIVTTNINFFIRITDLFISSGHAQSPIFFIFHTQTLLGVKRKQTLNVGCQGAMVIEAKGGNIANLTTSKPYQEALSTNINFQRHQQPLSYCQN